MTLSIVNREEINSVRPVRNQKAPRANAIKKLMLFKKPSWGLWDYEIPKNDKLKMTHVLFLHYPFFHWDENELSLLLLLLWRAVEYKLSRKGTVSFSTPIYVLNQYWDPRTSRKLKFQFFLEIKLFVKIKRNGSHGSLWRMIGWIFWNFESHV